MDGRITKRLFGTLLAAAIAISSVGCSNNKRTDFDALEAENNELRGQLAAL